MRKKAMITAAGVLAAVRIGGAALAGGGDREGTQADPKADRAVAAALEENGGGTANAVELDGENGATWEVEVTKEDGTTIDVRLDENYKVVVIEGDSEALDDDDSSN
jgi:hypothetical protein